MIESRKRKQFFPPLDKVGRAAYFLVAANIIVQFTVSDMAN